MKSAPFLFILIASCTSLAAPLAEDHVGRRLKTRTNDPSNPDNESPYTDIVTGNSVAKSRVIRDIGPSDATNRYFDWDESCSDAGQRTKIYAAWQSSQVLANSASFLLGKLQGALPQPLGGISSPNPDNQKYIFAEDPAFAQMFNARDAGIDYVTQSYASFLGAVKSAPSDRGTNAGLRFICNADNHILNGDGGSLCGTDAATAAQAITLPPQGPSDTAIEQKYRFQYSSSITFCPAFFDDTKFPLLTNIDLNTHNTLDKLDCADRIMLHEYLHLPFTRGMNPSVDYIGWQNCAIAASKLSWGTVKSLPDNYAWYSLYASANNFFKGCGEDAWPAGVAKPNTPPK